MKTYLIQVLLLLQLLSVLSNLSQGQCGMLMLFVDKLLTHRSLEREFFVILNTIGCGLLPKGAAFHKKKQAIFPKQTLKSKLIKFWQIAHLTVEEAGRANGSKKFVYWTSM